VFKKRSRIKANNPATIKKAIVYYQLISYIIIIIFNYSGDKMRKGNIVLVGMPGSGKSTTGVILAKTLKLPFIDTDLIIQQKEKLTLQEIIDKKGLDYFLKIEEKYALELNLEDYVIATGGSMIYSNSAILHLRKKNGIIIYLNLRYDEIQLRINNITTRGIAKSGNQSLLDLYKERHSFYEKYSNFEVICSEKDIEDVVEEIISKLSSRKMLIQT
jgi:shikimate kinase